MKLTLRLLIVMLVFSMRPSLSLAQGGGRPDTNFRGDTTFLHRIDSIINAHRGQDTGIRRLPPPPDTNRNPHLPDTIGGGPGHRDTIGGGPGLDSTFLHRIDSIIKARRGSDTGIHPLPPDTIGGGGPGRGDTTGGGPGLDSLFRHRLDSIFNGRRHNFDTGFHPLPPDTIGGGPGRGDTTGGGPGLDSLFRHRLDSIIQFRKNQDSTGGGKLGGGGQGRLDTGNIRNVLDSLIGRLLKNGRLDSIIAHLHGGGNPTGGGGTPDTTITTGGGGGTPDTTITTGGGGGTPDTTITTGGGGGTPDTTITTGGGGGTPDTTITTGGSGGTPDTTITTGGGGGTPDTTIKTGGGGTPDTTVKTGGGGNGGGSGGTQILPGGLLPGPNPVGGGPGLPPLDTTKHASNPQIGGGSSLSIAPLVPNPLSGRTNATLNLTLQTGTQVTVQIYDRSGNLVSQVANEEMTAGAHSLTINGSTLSTGVYIVQVQTGNESQTLNLMVQ